MTQTQGSDGDPLVSTTWLADRMTDPNVAVLDLRWRDDGSGRTRYVLGHIPGAFYLDWSADIVDPDHEIAFMLAPPERFARAMERCGVGDDTLVVGYADEGGSGPHRLWWACRVYGHDNVRVLDGGLERWIAEGRPVTDEEPRPPPMGVHWTAHPADRSLIADFADVLASERDPTAVVLDSRPPEQFRGEMVWFETGPIPSGPDGIARTPRGDLRAGHIPWARSIPASELYRDDGRMKSPEELLRLFASAHVVPGRRAIAYCGVGISAAAAAFALHRAGVRDVALYDASWDEWGRRREAPVEGG